ncbi:K02A2.6-like [Cordylochernes scorpioides]|uniref:K02A2.6-like n=1 Tax=Cordylochernes scorpioides TaxID=51811 RepID=A0ABY6L218_9ARAC|nr:K02A2.6-like [Cordylochernes scorpioides]
MKDQPYDTIIQRIKLHLDPKKKVIPQRFRFLKRIQQEGESISEYLRELKHLAINCNFVDMLGTMMRDRFVAGIKSEILQKKLLQEDDDFTLDKVFAVAISFELAEINTRELQDKLVAKISPGETDATINLTVDDYSLCFTIDTGSPVTLIPTDIYKNYCSRIILPGVNLYDNNKAKEDEYLYWCIRASFRAKALRLARYNDTMSDIDGFHAYWTAPIVPVLKKDGSVRICGDFRCTANKAIELDRYPLPSIDEIFLKLSRSTVFSTLDLSQAYLQVMLAEEAKAVVGINTTKRLFSYKRLPYDVAVAPNKFQRIMEGLFSDLPGVACYIDDILVAGKDFEDHEQKLDLVFR